MSTAGKPIYQEGSLRKPTCGSDKLNDDMEGLSREFDIKYRAWCKRRGLESDWSLRKAISSEVSSSNKRKAAK